MDVHSDFEKELGVLRERVLFLGAEVEQAFQGAVRALRSRDSEAAYSVLSHDEAVDEIEVYIDRQCLKVLTIPRPPAADLRLALCMVKISPLLERIADKACNIARIALALKEEPQHQIVPSIDAMANQALLMLRLALNAVTSADPIAARRVIESDSEMDRLYNHSLYSLFALIVAEPRFAPFHTKLLLTAKHIEHIGNYVSDICELTE